MKMALVLIVLILVVGGTFIAIAVAGYPEGTPLSLRIAVFDWIPGYERMVKWDARRAARADQRAGKSVLLSSGLYGARIAVEGCWVARYDRTPSMDSPMPWLSSRSGPAVVHCNGEGSRRVTAVSLVELGYSPPLPREIFARTYNEIVLVPRGV